MHAVIRMWRARLASAPAVDAFLAGGCDDSDGIDFGVVDSFSTSVAPGGALQGKAPKIRCGAAQSGIHEPPGRTRAQDSGRTVSPPEYRRLQCRYDRIRGAG
ncbi:hypothetical protein [Streptomyces sp. MBT62]|uniref:hypothetical protein n=1 Tax=Streptomyces sp. MBT62 TaxID=2800410 RepID=UPI0027DB37A7|nr:hypothetical protein [Streptomyces sp. MBT62]